MKDTSKVLVYEKYQLCSELEKKNVEKEAFEFYF
jgi:hypothetical protein